MPDNNIKVSIIVPCYNAENKLYKCVNSLENISFPKNELEVIFIDDCSTDRTVQSLKERSENHQNWHIEELSTNSGSPSLPRNIGIKKSRGDYVFFLDIDDEILPDAISELYSLAQQEKSDVVRSSLIVDDGEKQFVTNSIENFETYKSKNDIIQIIFKKQSTTPPALIRKKLLIIHNIIWDERIRMGEDTIFLAKLLPKAKNISYIDQPIYIYHKGTTTEASSTQTYGKRELLNHLYVWEQVENTLKPFGFSYFETRGQVALQTVLQAFKKYYQWDIDEKLFSAFSRFINQNWQVIQKFDFSPELKKMTLWIKEEKYDNFFKYLKPKLLIAGYDLKFILPIVPDLGKYYSVKIDEWTGHNIHNEKRSRQLLDWADIIFCEWLLGNAVWYAEHKLPYQKLIVRMHRFELTAQYGHKIKQDKVDTFITVGVYTFEQMIKTFGIGRNKSRLIHNYIDIENYETSDDPSKVFNLGIIGILPARKGYLNALKLLNQLKNKDHRYNLSIFGKMPHELSWIANDNKEMDYFNECEKYIKDNQLEKHIQVIGWVDTKIAVKDIGFVLSVSETGDLPESFHIAPAEGFASGNQGVFLHWNGVEFLYPNKYIFKNISNITDYIFANSDQQLFEKNRQEGFTFIEEKYSVKNFINMFNTIIK